MRNEILLIASLFVIYGMACLEKKDCIVGRYWQR